MTSKIILKKSSVAAKAPVAGDLVFGELAINYTDSKLYFKKADGSIDAFTTAAASAPVTSVGGNIGAITDTQLLTSIKNVDGAGSGLDADFLDGLNASAFYLASNPNGYTNNTGTVTSVGATSPLVSSGGNTPSISIPAANSTTNGYMSSAYAAKLDGIAAGATNVTNTNQLTNGAGYITSAALSSYLPLTGGTLTGSLFGTTITAAFESSNARFIFRAADAYGGSYSILGLNWGGTVGTYKNLAVYDYVNGRSMIEFIGDTRAVNIFGTSTVSTSSWAKWVLETIGTTAKARQGSDSNGLNFTTNALWNGAWIEDDTTKKKFAYIQHLGNGRHEFRTAAAGAGVSWVTSLTIDDNAVNSSVALTQGGNQVLHAGNYTSYAPSLTGSGASGTWGINITGNAASAGGISSSSSTGIQSSFVTTINTTTPGLTTYGLAFSGSSAADNAQGITWGWSGTSAQAGIYVQSSGAYGTKMYLATTDSFATGAKTAVTIDHNGHVSLNRGTFSNGSVWINNGTNSNGYNENIRLFNAPNGVSVIAFSASGISGTPTTSILGYSDRMERRFSDAWQDRMYNGYVEASGSYRAQLFYDSNNTAYYVDPATGSNIYNIDIQNQLQVMGQTYLRANIYSLNSAATGWNTFLDRNGGDYIVYGGNSVRAPIFYDSQNTAYFTDPAGRSRQSQIDFGDGGYYIHGGSWGMRNTTPYGYIEFGPANSGHAHIYTDRSNFYFNQQIQVNGGSQINTSDIRAGIFYDQQDTGYYIDPNSTSDSALRMRGGALFGPNTSWGASLYVGGNGRVGTSASVAVTNGNLHIDSQNGYELYLNWYNTANIYTQSNLGVGSSSASYRLHVHGTGYATSDFRAPIFYDANDTAYYTDQNNTSSYYRININNNILFTNYGRGMIGTYASTRYQAVFAMGDSYKLPDDGTTTGSLYGLAWSHPNAGGTAGNLNTHGLLVLENGGFLAAVSGSIRSRDDMRSPIFYDSNNTGYYNDPASVSYLYGLTLAGGSYFRPQNWIQFDGSYGLYWPNHYGAHLHANDLSTYTQLALRGSKNSYGGIYDQFSAVNIGMYDSGGNGGVYREANGRWFSYYNVGNDCWGFGTSSTSSAYNLYAPKGIYSGGRVDGTIFYDSNNTGYYLDPTATSKLIGNQHFISNRNTSSDTPPLQAYSDNASGAIMAFHRAGYYAVNFGLDSDNVMRIGGWSAAVNRWQLDMSGNGTYAGNVTAYSDERLKCDWELLAVDFVDRLAQVKSGTYTRTDSGERQAGSSAQDWQKLLPEVVTIGNDEDKTLALAYGNAALVSAIELAKRIVEQDARIALLEERLSKLLGE